MKILFTGYYFDTYSGSQMYITEMAQYLRGKGHQITIASPNISEEIANNIKKYNITLIEPQDVNVTECYDIVFAAHHPIINDLLKRNLKYKKIVNVCLGTYHPLEEPVHFYKKIDLFVANSHETKQKLIFKNKIKEERVFVLPNFLPDNFTNYSYDKSDVLKRIAIISNHVPQELKDIQSYFEGISVDYYGIEYEQAKVTPELLSKYDAIITIGKTVQYGMGMEIPVYEYDMFGGCGYITPDNYEKEKEFNFSGRATNRQISTSDISQEVVSNFKKAKENAPILKSKSMSDFPLGNIDKLMTVITALPDTKKVKPKKEYINIFKEKVKDKVFSIKKYNNKTLKVITVFGVSFKIRKKLKK